jgi:hypothetical protein
MAVYRRLNMTNSKWLTVGASALLICATTAMAQSSFGDRLFERWVQRRMDFAAFVTSLNLTPTQQTQAQTVQTQAKAFRAGALATSAATAAKVKQDLQNPQSNLRATVQMVQSTIDREIALHRALTAERLRFYDTLSPSQQATVRAEIVTRIERMEKLRNALADLAE